MEWAELAIVASGARGFYLVLPGGSADLGLSLGSSPQIPRLAPTTSARGLTAGRDNFVVQTDIFSIVIAREDPASACRVDPTPSAVPETAASPLRQYVTWRTPTLASA